MPVRPSRNPKVQERTPHFEKPDHTRPAKERTVIIARDFLTDAAFLAACKALGKTPSIRQARRFLACRLGR